LTAIHNFLGFKKARSSISGFATFDSGFVKLLGLIALSSVLFEVGYCCGRDRY
jgi:hypothetical protein